MFYKVVVILAAAGVLIASPDGYGGGGHGGGGHGGGGHGGGYGGGPTPYSFGYNVNGKGYGPNFGHSEKGDGHNVHGSYTVALPDGRKQHVQYTASGYGGFVAKVSYSGKAQHPSYSGPAVTFAQNGGGGYR